MAVAQSNIKPMHINSRSIFKLLLKHGYEIDINSFKDTKFREYNQVEKDENYFCTTVK